MRMGKSLRGFALLSSLAIIGCAGDIAVHEDVYEDRHVSHPRYVEERVYHEAPPPRPLPPQEDVQVSVDSRTDAAPPPLPPPSSDEQVSADYDNGDTRVDVDVNEAPDDQDATYFQSDLQPYGDWVVTADFGRCFRPRGIAVDWRPYTEGHWVYTDDGWLWASDEPFGWATYHYGRWTEDARYGWVWVPGRTWAPAWVAWRHGGGNAGWAPLPPRRRGEVSDDINVEIGRIRPNEYTFVDERYIDAPHVRQHARPVQQNVTIINNTTNITNITTVNHKVVNKGVSVTEVEQATGHKVKKVNVVQTADKTKAKESADTVAVFKKDLPPKKKKPAVASETNTRNTVSTPVDPSRNKKPAPTDTTPLPKKKVDVAQDIAPKKKPTDNKSPKPLADETSAGKKNDTNNKKTETNKQTDDARGRSDNRDAVNNNTNHNKPDDQPKAKKPSDKGADKPDVSHTDKKVKPDDAAPDTSSKNKNKVDTDNDDNKSSKHTKPDDTPKPDPHKTDKPKVDDSPKSDSHKEDKPKVDDTPKGKRPDNGGKGDSSDNNGKKNKDRDNGDANH